MCGNVGVLDVVLEVRHQHEVARLVPAVVQPVVVDVAEDGAGTDPVSLVLGVNEVAQLLHRLLRVPLDDRVGIGFPLPAGCIRFLQTGYGVSMTYQYLCFA